MNDLSEVLWPIFFTSLSIAAMLIMEGVWRMHVQHLKANYEMMLAAQQKMIERLAGDMPDEEVDQMLEELLEEEYERLVRATR